MVKERELREVKLTARTEKRQQKSRSLLILDKPKICFPLVKFKAKEYNYFKKHNEKWLAKNQCM